MGLTHYWAIETTKKGMERKYQRALFKCAQLVRAYSEKYGGISGFTAHTEPGLYKGLHINGSKNSGMGEDFVLTEKFKENEPQSFCKTNGHEYDILVVACLHILKHELGESFNWSSDHRPEHLLPGKQLAQKVQCCSTCAH